MYTTLESSNVTSWCKKCGSYSGYQINLKLQHEDDMPEEKRNLYKNKISDITDICADCLEVDHKRLDIIDKIQKLKMEMKPFKEKINKLTK